MKTESIAVYPLSATTDVPLSTAHETFRTAHFILVEGKTDVGLIGYGEVHGELMQTICDWILRFGEIVKSTILLSLMLMAAQAACAFDQTHGAWDELLKRAVVVAPNGTSSRVDYAVLKRDDRALNAYLGELSAITMDEFQSWSPDHRLAFLINAYNAYTVKLVLTRYPGVKTIKDLGSILQSPWKKEFFTLLGAPRSLDGIEHGLIRVPGVFDEPRIHFALNCASIGCPMLRDEAYAAPRLEGQLDSATRRFLSDRSRNRYDVQSGTLEISAIFDWYKGDFGKDRGVTSVRQFVARYADAVADNAAAQAVIRREKTPLRFLDYDWALNDIVK